MHRTKRKHSKAATQLDANEHYRAIFSACGLRYGQHYGSKSGYVRDNPQSFYIPNSCIVTREGVCVWRGDLDLAVEDIQQSLIDASRRLGRKFFVLREQTQSTESWPQAWLRRDALVTVWRGQLSFNPRSLPDALSEAMIRQRFGKKPPRKIQAAAALMRAALRAHGHYLVAIPPTIPKQDRARARQLSPEELAVLARRLAASRNKTEKEALESEIVRGFYSKPK